MARQSLKNVMPPEVPEVSPTKITPVLQVNEMQDNPIPEQFSYVVLQGSQITKREYDEAKRGKDVVATRDIGFLRRGADGYLIGYFYYPKDNSYYRGLYTYKVEDFERSVVGYEVSLILTNNGHKEAA